MIPDTDNFADLEEWVDAQCETITGRMMDDWLRIYADRQQHGLRTGRLSAERRMTFGTCMAECDKYGLEWEAVFCDWIPVGDYCELDPKYEPDPRVKMMLAWRFRPEFLTSLRRQHQMLTLDL